MIEISVAQLSEQRAIIKLLNELTLDLFEKGIRQWHYPWRAETIQQQLGAQRRYVVKEGNELIGSFLLTSGTHYDPFAFPQKSLVLAEINFLPNYQGLGFSKDVFNYAIQQARLHHLPLYLASPVKHPKLERLFTAAQFELADRSPLVYLYRYSGY